jgi:hypothetical protein
MNHLMRLKNETNKLLNQPINKSGMNNNDVNYFMMLKNEIENQNNIKETIPIKQQIEEDNIQLNFFSMLKKEIEEESANEIATTDTKPETTDDGDGTKPTGDGVKPNDDDTKPTGDDTKPTDDGVKPTDDDTKPTGDGTKPTDDGTKPTGDGVKPTDDGTKPTDDGTKPTDIITGVEKPKLSEISSGDLELLNSIISTISLSSSFQLILAKFTQNKDNNKDKFISAFEKASLSAAELSKELVSTLKDKTLITEVSKTVESSIKAAKLSNLNTNGGGDSGANGGGATDGGGDSGGGDSGGNGGGATDGGGDSGANGGGATDGGGDSEGNGGGATDGGGDSGANGGGATDGGGDSGDGANEGGDVPSDGDRAVHPKSLDWLNKIKQNQKQQHDAALKSLLHAKNLLLKD